MTILAAVARAAFPSHRDKLDALAAARLRAAHARPAFEEILGASANDFDWLLEADLQPRLRTDLLSTLILSASRSDKEKAGLLESPRLGTLLRTLLSTTAGEPAAAELIADANHLDNASFALAAKRFATRESKYSIPVLAKLIASVTPLSSVADVVRLEHVLSFEMALPAIPAVAPTLVDLLMPERVRHEDTTYSLALTLAGRMADGLRGRFVEALPIVTRRAYVPYRLAPEAYVAWGRLVEEAVSLGGKVGQAASESAIEYATRREFDTLLPLVMAAFPPVFNAANAGGRKQRRDAQYLARSIVRLFVRHDWDGGEFLRLVMRTHDERAMFEAAKECWGAPDYIRHAFQMHGVPTNMEWPSSAPRLTQEAEDYSRLMDSLRG